MGQTLTNGLYLPAEGERNCYSGLESNWRALDAVIGGYNTHIANLDIHVTAADKNGWNGHVGNSDIHVTAADKEAWNGKADASALTAHTGNTTIHVTAADKEAWNGKADDTDVIHISGNEQSTGFKQFDNIRLYNSIRAVDLDNQTVDINTCYSTFAPTGAGGNGNTCYYCCNTDSGTTNITNLPEKKAFFLIAQTLRVIFGSVYVKQTCITTNGYTFVRYCKDNTWSTWNNIHDELEPSSLSLPVADRSLRIDISGYFTNTTSGGTNEYTVVDNGYIMITVSAAVQVIAGLYTSPGKSLIYNQSYTGTTASAVRVLFPVAKGNIFILQSYSSSAISFSNAFFIPCQGNV